MRFIAVVAALLLIGAFIFPLVMSSGRKVKEQAEDAWKDE